MGGPTVRLFAKELSDGRVEFWVESSLQETLPAGPRARFEAMELARAASAFRKVPLLLEATLGDSVSNFRVFPDGRVESLRDDVESSVSEGIDPSPAVSSGRDEGAAPNVAVDQSVSNFGKAVEEGDQPVIAEIIDGTANRQLESVPDVFDRVVTKRRSVPWQRTLILGAGLVLVVAAGFFSWRAVNPDADVVPNSEVVAAQSSEDVDQSEGNGGEVAAEVLVRRSGDRSVAVVVTPTTGNADVSDWSFVVGEQTATLEVSGSVLVGEVEGIPAGSVRWMVSGPGGFELENAWDIQ